MNEYRKQRAITAERVEREIAEFESLMEQTAPEDRTRVIAEWLAWRRERSQDVPADQEHGDQER